MTTRSFTVSGALVSHQVRRYLGAVEIAFVEDESFLSKDVTFTVDVDDEQWAGIQDWVARL